MAADGKADGKRQKQKRAKGRDWRRKRNAVLRRYRYTCQYPGCSQIGDTPSNPLTIDHVVPLWRGGSNAQVNLTVLCYRHNQLKGLQEQPPTRKKPTKKPPRR